MVTKMFMKEFPDFLKKGAGFGIAGGLIAYIIASITSALGLATMPDFVTLGIGLILLWYGTKISKIDNVLKIVDWFMLFGFITLAGSTLMTFVPISGLDNYILSVNVVGISGFIWTFAYVLIADGIAGKWFK